VYVWTRLPDLKPRGGEQPPPRYPEDSGSSGSWGEGNNHLYVNLVSVRQGPQGPIKTYEHVRRQYRLVSRDVYGLQQYRRACTTTQTKPDGSLAQLEEECPALRSDQFIGSSTELDRWIHLDCVRAEDNPAGGCLARIAHRGWVVQFVFRRTELPRWREFDEAVRRLFDGFVARTG